MIPEDLERQISLAEAEVSEVTGLWGGPFSPHERWFGFFLLAIPLTHSFISTPVSVGVSAETCRWVRF